MEAIVVTGPGKFEYTTSWAEPTPGPGEVRIQVAAAGICGTDIHITRGDESLVSIMKPPVVLGHEFCGFVDSWGKDVEGFKKGEFVSAEMHRVCKVCPACADGKHHACQFTQIQGIHDNGAFANFVVVPAWNVVKLPKVIPVKIAAIMDAFGNAVHAALKANIRERTVGIVGYGPIGAMAAEIALFRGASHLYIIEVSERALTRAREWVALRNASDRVTLINANRDKAVEKVIDLTKGGVDVSLEFSGASAGFNTALSATRYGGEAVLLGIPKDHAVVIQDYGKNIIWKGLTLHGIIGRELFKTWDTMIELLEEGLDLDFLVTGQFPLREFEVGLDRFRNHEEQKVVLYPKQ